MTHRGWSTSPRLLLDQKHHVARIQRAPPAQAEAYKILAHLQTAREMGQESSFSRPGHRAALDDIVRASKLRRAEHNNILKGGGYEGATRASQPVVNVFHEFGNTFDDAQGKEAGLEQGPLDQDSFRKQYDPMQKGRQPVAKGRKRVDRKPSMILADTAQEEASDRPSAGSEMVQHGKQVAVSLMSQGKTVLEAVLSGSKATLDQGMAESLLAETIAQVLAPSLSLFAPLSSLNRCCHSGSCRGEAVGGRSGRSVGLARAWAKHVHSVLAAKHQPNVDDEQGKGDIPEKVEG